MQDKKVTLKAADGSTGVCKILESKDGKVRVQHVDSGKEYTLSESAFNSSIVKEQMDEAWTMPAPVVQRGQLVRVYEKNTNKQVDTGVVTEAGRDYIKIGEEQYQRDQYSWLVLA